MPAKMVYIIEIFTSDETTMVPHKLFEVNFIKFVIKDPSSLFHTHISNHKMMYTCVTIGKAKYF